MAVIVIINVLWIFLQNMVLICSIHAGNCIVGIAWPSFNSELSWLHRAIFGSIERFFGILVENFAGAFPIWLAPVQCRILPVTDGILPIAQDVLARMKKEGIRAEIVAGGVCTLSKCIPVEL